jgi:hypothetical protein
MKVLNESLLKINLFPQQVSLEMKSKRHSAKIGREEILLKKKLDLAT